MNRLFSVGCWLGVALFGAGCGSAVLETHQDGEGGAGGDGGTPRGVSNPSVGSGGRADPETPADPELTVEDSGTLDVSISVSAYGVTGTPAGEVQVQLMVTIHEWETDRPVTDAVVTVGPPGRPLTLGYSVHSEATYFTMTTGYERQWEISIVRGDDHLTGVVLLGPSLHGVTAADPVDGGAIIGWSPSAEPGVRTVVCANSIDPAGADPCGEAHDEGSLDLVPVNAGDTIVVDRRTKVPVGIAGSATVDVVVSSQIFLGW